MDLERGMLALGAEEREADERQSRVKEVGVLAASEACGTTGAVALMKAGGYPSCFVLTGT
jgi:hypothetical protein